MIVTLQDLKALQRAVVTGPQLSCGLGFVGNSGLLGGHAPAGDRRLGQALQGIRSGVCDRAEGF